MERCINNLQGKSFNIGEIKKPREIGRRGRNKFIYVACPDCGKRRWVDLWYFAQGNSLKCHSCAAPGGENNHFWKGGRATNSDGYVNIRVYTTSPFYSMADKQGYVLEHRLVMAQHLNRCLQPWEMVHHINGQKSNNSIENLQLTTKASHRIAYEDAFRDGYRKGCKDTSKQRNDELLKQIRLLQWQVKELSQSSMFKEVK